MSLREEVLYLDQMGTQLDFGGRGIVPSSKRSF